MNLKRFIIGSIVVIILIVVLVVVNKPKTDEVFIGTASLDNRNCEIVRGSESETSTDSPEDYELVYQVWFVPVNGDAFTETIRTGYNVPTNTVSHYLNFDLPEREKLGSEYLRVYWEYQDSQRIYGTVKDAKHVGNHWYELAGLYSVYLPIVTK